MSDAAYLSPPGSMIAVASAEPDRAHIPPPKASTVPSTDEVLHDTKKAQIAGATTGTLIAISDRYVERIFNQYRTSLTETLTALAEPPPPQDESRALKILAAIVEIGADVLLTRLGGRLVQGLVNHVGETTVDAAKEAVRATGKKVGTAAGSWAEHSGQGERSEDTIDASQHFSGDPAAKTMLDQYRSMQVQALETAATEARVRLLLLQDAIARVNHGDAAALATSLQHYAGEATNFTDFEYQVAAGWMKFCSTTAVERVAANPKARRPRASLTDGYGFLDISIEVPEMAYGVAGLQLGSVDISKAGPGLRRIMQYAESRPLLSVQTYRRIQLAGPGSKLNSEWAIVISPDGQIEIDENSVLLAAIGRAAPTVIDDSYFSHPNADARYARLGADLVRSWLGKFTTTGTVR